MTIREQVVNNIISEIKTISGVQASQVKHGSLMAQDIEELSTSSMPFYAVDDMGSQKVFNDQALDEEQWQANILVEIVTQGTPSEADAKLGELHDKLMEDARRGGFAEDTERVRDEKIPIASYYEQDRMYRVLTFWEVKFTHDRGKSSQQI